MNFLQNNDKDSKTPVYFIPFRYQHHATHSGYDRLTHYLGEIVESINWIPRFLPKKLLKFNFNPQSLALELGTIRKMMKSKRSIYHILYEEKKYRYISLFNKLRENCLVATVHVPPPLTTTRHLLQLSALICVGTSQLDYFIRLLGRERVFFVPHGIDTDYFSPPLSFASRNPNLCLFVGQFFRDYLTLSKVIEQVACQRPEVEFVVVTEPERFKEINCRANIVLRSKVKESDLLQLYRSASLMVMPLLDTTANNSILEAIACGLPVVVTDVGSIRDYLNSSCAVFVPAKNTEGMANAVLELLIDRTRLRKMSQQARLRALEFSWFNIAEKLQGVYRNCLKTSFN